MEALTREQKLELCIKAKALYELNKGKMGLCETFKRVVNEGREERDYVGQYKVVTEIIPEILEHKPIFKALQQFWWTPSSVAPRIKVLDALIERFSKEG